MTNEEKALIKKQKQKELSRKTKERKKRAAQNRKNKWLGKGMAADSGYHERMCDNNGKEKLRFGKSHMAGKGTNIPNVRKRK